MVEVLFDVPIAGHGVVIDREDGDVSVFVAAHPAPGWLLADCAELTDVEQAELLELPAGLTGVATTDDTADRARSAP